MSCSDKIIIERCQPSTDAWNAVLSHAIIAMVGNGKCTSQNVKSSCFGAEWCDRGYDMKVQTTYVLEMMRENQCYAALHSYEKTLLGVVSVSPSSSATQHMHTFCVVDRERGRGVGKKMMTFVLDRFGNKTLELTVADAVGHGDAANTLRERHDRLVALYRSFGFRETGKSDGYTRMVREANCNIFLHALTK